MTDAPPPVWVCSHDDVLARRLSSAVKREGGFPLAADPARPPVLVIGCWESPAEIPPAVQEAVSESACPLLVLTSGGTRASRRSEWGRLGATLVLDEGATTQEVRAVIHPILQGDSPADGGEPTLADFASHSPCMREFVDMVTRVADTDATLLVRGQTGVGKEHLSRAIHGLSARSAGRFVTINCAAIPRDLLESELFGHERGAFTGADKSRVGRFEAADGGTLFLDEVGEMPLELQVKLLAVLQQREITPIGGHEPRPVNVRLVAATNADLEAMIADGSFREDLFYRLNVVTLQIPSLAERKEDIPELAGQLLARFADEHERPVTGISSETLRELMAYGWPGNVRELVNVIERAVLLARGEQIEADDLPPRLRNGPGVEPVVAGAALEAGGLLPPDWREQPLRELKDAVVSHLETMYLENLLRELDGRVGKVAERAGLSPRSLHTKMKLYGLRKEDYLEG